MLKLNHFGSRISSGGIAGQPPHGYSPIMARAIFVKVLQRVIPPAARIASRVLTMCGAWAESPAILRAR